MVRAGTGPDTSTVTLKLLYILLAVSGLRSSSTPVNSIFTALALDFRGAFYILIGNALYLQLTCFLIQHFIHRKLVIRWPIFIVYSVYTHRRQCNTLKTSMEWPVSGPYTQLLLVKVFSNLDLLTQLRKWFHFTFFRRLSV